MFRFSLKAQTSAIILTTVIGCALIGYAGLSTVERIDQIHGLWDHYTNESLTDTQLLHRLHRAFGYGGFIHNFKNYVLRADPSRLPLIERDLKALNSALDTLERRAHHPETLQAMARLRAVVDEYTAKLEIARRMVAEDASPRQIDALVKVDDTPALAAIEVLAQHALEHGITGEAVTDHAIEASLRGIGLGALLLFPLLVAAATLTVFMLVRLTRQIERRRSAEAELEESREQAQLHRDQLAHLSRIHTVGEMTTGIAHEVNQPLAAIGGYVQAALRRVERQPPETEKLRELLTKIDAQAARAGEVVARLRSMVKREPSNHIEVDINLLLHATAELAELECRRRGIRLILEPGEALPPVHVDPVQLEQVTLNLIQNALEASERSSHPGAAQVVIRSARDDDGRVEVSVADHGPGIPDELGDEVFNAFVTTKAEGLGVGLAICRTIIETFDGTIDHAPNPGGGTRIRYTLPPSPRTAK